MSVISEVFGSDPAQRAADNRAPGTYLQRSRSFAAEFSEIAEKALKNRSYAER